MSKQERIYFEKFAFKIMQAISSKFTYNIKEDGNFQDIADLFIYFYKHMDMKNKIEDIIHISSKNLFSNSPFICMLFKWLIELTRKIYSDNSKISHEKNETVK